MKRTIRRFWWIGAIAVAIGLGMWWTGRDEAPARTRLPALAGGERAEAPAPVAFGTENGLASADPIGALRLEGQVLDGDERPVGGAQVTIDTIPPRTIATEEDGSFGFDDLLPRHYSLVAIAPEGVAGPATARLTASSDPVILRLRAAAAIDVAVVDAATGRPIEGASVEVRGAGAARRTGADGVAALEPLVPGRWPLVVAAPGYGTAFDTVVASAEARTEVAIALHDGVRVRGRVRDETGAAVADALVWAEPTGAWTGEPDPQRDGVRTGADGSFELGGVGRGTHLICALAPGFAPGATAPLHLDGDLDGVELTLARGMQIAGRTVRRDGTPATGAVVRVSWTGGARMSHVDGDGRFAIGALPSGSVWIVARDPEASSQPRRMVLDEVSPEEAATLELVLDNEGVIAGVVVDRTGAPIEGAQVSGKRLDLAERSGLAASRPELTDAAGRFALRGLEPGEYRLAATRDPRDLARAVETSGTLVSAGATDVRLVLEADGTIAGRVAFRSGGSPATYVVRLGRTGMPTTFTTDRFELTAPPGRHALWIEGPGFTAASVDGLVAVAAETTDAGTVVVDRGRVLRGVVVDATGAAAPGAEVTAGTVLSGTGARADVGEGGPGFRSDVKRTTTRADGSFELTGVTSAPLSLVAVSSAGRSAPVAVPAGSDDVTGLTLAMLREGRLAGVVSSAGRPLRAIVNAQAHESPLAMMTVMSSDGAYHFDHLAPGRYTVAPVAGDPYSGSPFYPRAVEVRAGATTTLDLPVEPGSATLTVEAPGVSAGLVFVTTRPGSATSALALVIELGQQDGGQWAIAPVRDGGAVFRELATGQARACVVAMTGDGDRDTSALFEEMVRTGGGLAATCDTVSTSGSVTLAATGR